jgi:hypothetical protein
VLVRFDMIARQYRLSLFQAELYPLTGDRANDIYHIVASVVLIGGLVALLWRARASFMTAFAAVYVALLAISPVAEVRYLWPLFPICVAGLAIGARWLFARVLAAPAMRAASAMPSAAAAALLAVVALGALRVELARPRPPSLLGAPDAEALFAWLRQARAREPLRVVFDNPRVLALETGVPAMGHVRRSPPGHLVAYADAAITHVVWQRPEASGCLQRIANRLAESDSTRFALEYENPTYRVYRRLPSAAPIDTEFEVISWSRPSPWCG